MSNNINPRPYDLDVQKLDQPELWTLGRKLINGIWANNKTNCKWFETTRPDPIFCCIFFLIKFIFGKNKSCHETFLEKKKKHDFCRGMLGKFYDPSKIPKLDLRFTGAMIAKVPGRTVGVVRKTNDAPRLKADLFFLRRGVVAQKD